MSASEPLFSIITATYNAAPLLPVLLDNLAEQTCRDFELVVQDACSRDATLVLLNGRADIPAVSLRSERDSGIYDAWNRAVARARGRWLIFLGCDDRFADADVLARVADVVEQLPDSIRFAAGEVQMLDAQGRCRLRSIPVLDGGRERMRFLAPAAFPGTFIRKDIAVMHPFDASLRISADYDFFCRTWEDGQAVLLPFMVGIMLEGGISSSPENQLFAAWENACVAARYFPRAWTPERAKVLCKAGLVTAAFRLLGRRQGAKVLDTIRKWRGLPPCWER